MFATKKEFDTSKSQSLNLERNQQSANWLERSSAEKELKGPDGEHLTKTQQCDLAVRKVNNLLCCIKKVPAGGGT